MHWPPSRSQTARLTSAGIWRGFVEERLWLGCGRGRSSTTPRYIPADVKRSVWERDGGQCTFASEAGRRCPARTRLELDHIDPVARGGEATAHNLRLRCRGHNQYEAECTFGTVFMSGKRRAAQHAPGRVTARTRAAGAEPSSEQDVLPWLRQLGFRPDEALRAAARCEAIPDAPLEQRLRLALSCFAKLSQRPPARILPAAT